MSCCYLIETTRFRNNALIVSIMFHDAIGPGNVGYTLLLVDKDSQFCVFRSVENSYDIIHSKRK